MPTVRDLMLEPAATARHDATLDQVLCSLLESDSSELYVTDEDDRLLGIVTEYDLLKAQMTGTAGDLPAQQLMSRNVPTVSPDTQVAAIAVLFRDGCHRQMSVVQGARLIGVVRRRDVLRVIAVPQLLAEGSSIQEELPAGVRRPKFAVESRTCAVQAK
jgi:CBS domain-containing protein